MEVLKPSFRELLRRAARRVRGKRSQKETQFRKPLRRRLP